LNLDYLKPKGKGRSGTVYARIVGASSICVLGITLVAGLWPLHVPQNQVSWLKNDSGLSFGRHGSIVSSGAFRDNDSMDDFSCSLEIWLQRRVADARKTVLSFDRSTPPRIPFSLHQDKDGLRIERHNIDNDGTSRTAWFNVAGVFRENKPVFVTITLGKQDTSVYLGGVLVKVSPILGVATNNFTGRLVIADSPTAHDSWSGEILGLAMYHHRLTSVQVAQHYENWTLTRRPTRSEDEAPVALYLFDERNGNIAHNQLDSATNLIIPSRYSVLHPGFLMAPWREYKRTWSYWQNFSVNIAGFIPLGFCLATYFSSVKVIDRPRATTIVLGFIVSLTIEILQASLPTRSSGTTDLVTNTLGTAVGVMLFGCSFTQRLLAKASHDFGSFLGDSSQEKTSGNTKVVAAA
jgi:VanZ family protein